MDWNQIIREYLNDIPGASQRGIEDAHDKIVRSILSLYSKADVEALCEIAAAAGRKANEIAIAKRAHELQNWRKLPTAIPIDDPALGPYQPQDISKLMGFYDVTTHEALIFAQAHHIEKLQSKIPPTPDMNPQVPREG